MWQSQQAKSVAIFVGSLDFVFIIMTRLACDH